MLALAPGLAGRRAAGQSAPDTLPGTIVARSLAGGTRLAFYAQPGVPLVAVRLSFPLATGEGAPQALAGMAQWLARAELEREAAAYGARIELENSETHAVFCVVGAASDFAALVAMLSRATRWGGWSERMVETARLVAAARAGEDTETPEPLLRRRLAAKLFPALPANADAVPASVSAARLERFWLQTFRPERMQAVVVGDVPEPQAAALLGGWPPPLAPPEGSGPGGARGRSARRDAPARAAGGGSAGRPQVLFDWAGTGWPTDANAATLAVAARLIRDRVPADSVRDARVELWWAGGRRALVALGSATTESTDAKAVRRRLAGGVTAVAAAVTGAEVATARRAAVDDILLAGRTPQGLARYIGQLFERTDDATAAQAFLRALGAVQVEDIRSALTGLGDATVAEVRG